MPVKSKKKKQPLQQKTKQVKPVVKQEFFNDIHQWTPVAVLIFIFLLYARALYNGFANLDDDKYIVLNPYIRSLSWPAVKAIFSTFYNSNYHPLTTLTYLFEYSLFKLNPFPYHLLNVLLHVLNTWLVFKLTEKLSGKRITALVVCILFAVHPMHVESVAWISERKDMLYTLFYLLSLLVYLRYIKGGYHIKYYAGAMLLFAASLLSKSAAVTLPVLLIAIDFYKGRKITVKSLLEKVPFLLLSVVFGILAILSQQLKEGVNEISMSFSFIERIFLFTYTIAFYIVKLVAPVNLCVMHYYPNDTTLPWSYFASLPFLLLLALLFFKRTLFRREMLFGAFFFLISISVMLQVVHVGFALTAERYTYIPYIGLFYIAGQWISGIAHKKVMNTVIMLFTLVIIVFSFQTWNRISMWKDGDVLFTDVINKNPGIYHGYWTRGNIKNNNGDLQGALKDYNKTMECNPQFALCLTVRGDVRNKLNDFKGALEDLNHALQMDTTTAETYNYRGMAYEGLGNTTLALTDYNKAILRNPQFMKAYNNRGVLRAKTGDLDGALKDMNTAISLTPFEATLYSYRGNIKNFKKDYEGAIKDFNYALKIEPGFAAAFYNRGMSRYYLKDTTGACGDWKKAAQLGDKIAPQTLKQYCK